MKNLKDYIIENSSIEYREYLKDSFDSWKGKEMKEVIPDNWNYTKDSHYSYEDEERYFVETPEGDEISIYLKKGKIKNIEFEN